MAGAVLALVLLGVVVVGFQAVTQGQKISCHMTTALWTPQIFTVSEPPII